MALDTTTTAQAFAALTTDAPALRRALTLAGHVIDARTRIPVLQQIKAEARPGALSITATDLDLALTVTMPAETDDTGAALLNPAALAAPLAKVKGKAALMFGGAEMVLEAGGVSISGSDCLPIEDFPIMSPILMQDRAQIEARDLAAALAHVLPCVSTDATRYYLNGILFHGHKAGADAPAALRLVSTDGHRLARFDLGGDWPDTCASDSRGGVIVPTKTCEVLARLIKESPDALISIATDHHHATRIVFAGGNWTLESRVIDGTFPDYSRVIPTDRQPLTFMLSAEEVPAIPRGAKSLAVKLDATAGRMSWTDHATDTVAGRDLLAEGEGAVGFNARYLADLCKTGPITINAAPDGSPALIFGADSRCLRVLMPMRV